MGVYIVSDFRNMSVDDLYAKMGECEGPGYYQMAVEELQRRYLTALGEHVSKLEQSSIRMEVLTRWLNGLTVVLVLLTAALLVKEVVPRRSAESHVTTVKPIGDSSTYIPDNTWISAAREWGWSGLRSWTDASILRNLSTPEGFRAAFPEYGTWTDDQIKKISVQPASHPYRGLPPGFKVLSPDGRVDLTAGLVPKEDWTIKNREQPVPAGWKQGMYSSSDIKEPTN